MNNIIVFYPKGGSGQWFTHFVNQHPGFSPSKLALNPNNIEYNVDTKLPGPGNPTDFKKFTGDAKTCFTFFSWHFYTSVFSDLPGILTQLKENNVDTSILLYAKKDSKYEKIMRLRNKELFCNDFPGELIPDIVNAYTELSEQHAKETAQHLKEHTDLKVHLLDIAGLFELDEDVYGNLLNIIGTGKIPTWREEITSMINQVYGKYI